jgi:hypothetical protein
MDVLGELLVAVIAVISVWRFVARIISWRARADGPVEPGDSSDVPAPVRHGPGASSGAVALEEPEQEEDFDQ